MGKWSEQIIATLDNKLSDTKQRDIRFYRVEEFKRNIERVGSFSASCSTCNNEKKNISAIIEKIDEAIDVPGNSRREYDRLISRLAAHMQKSHGFFTPYHFSYLYSFLGIVAGLLLGYLLMKLNPAHGGAMLSAGFVAGLIAGYFSGAAKDRKIRSSKKLM